MVKRNRHTRGGEISVGSARNDRESNSKGSDSNTKRCYLPEPRKRCLGRCIFLWRSWPFHPIKADGVEGLLRDNLRLHIKIVHVFSTLQVSSVLRFKCRWSGSLGMIHHYIENFKQIFSRGSRAKLFQTRENGEMGIEHRKTGAVPSSGSSE